MSNGPIMHFFYMPNLWLLVSWKLYEINNHWSEKKLFQDFTFFLYIFILTSEHVTINSLTAHLRVLSTKYMGMFRGLNTFTLLLDLQLGPISMVTWRHRRVSNS